MKKRKQCHIKEEPFTKRYGKRKAEEDTRNVKDTKSDLLEMQNVLLPYLLHPVRPSITGMDLLREAEM